MNHQCAAELVFGASDEDSISIHTLSWIVLQFFAWGVMFTFQIWWRRSAFQDNDALCSTTHSTSSSVLNTYLFTWVTVRSHCLFTLRVLLPAWAELDGLNWFACSSASCKLRSSSKSSVQLPQSNYCYCALGLQVLRHLGMLVMENRPTYFECVKCIHLLGQM